MISKLIRQIPNLLTLSNLLCGVLAIHTAYTVGLLPAAGLIFLGACFDFFDGFAARMLGVSSPIGKELDSLADMVTFGLAPGVLLFKLLSPSQAFFAHLSWLLPLCAALRLAKFNTDQQQTHAFSGLPTPAAALFIGSLPFIHHHQTEILLFNHPLFLLLLAPLISLLMVAPLPLFALKFKHFRWQGNQSRYLLIASVPLFLLFFSYAALPLVICFYIILSLFQAKITGSS